MSKKNNKFRKNTTNKLGIKVGDWFEEINPDSEIKTFFKVRSIENGEIEFIIIPLETRYSVDYCSLDVDNEGWRLSRFQRDGKDRLKFKKYHSEQYITFQRRDEKFVLDQLLEDLRIGFILECFGKNKDNPQNQPTSQSTPSENKPKTEEDDLGLIKVGDYYHYSSPYSSYNSSREFYTRVNSVSRLDRGTRFDRYIISGDGFSYTLDNGIPKHLEEETDQRWFFRIKEGRIREEEGQKITKEEYNKKLKEIKHQVQPKTKPTTDSPSKKRIEEPKEELNLKVGDWLRGTEYTTCCSLDLKSIFFVSKIETDSIFLENAIPENIRFDQSIESEPWNRENFYREDGKIYFKSEDHFIEFEKISKDEVLDTLRSWSTTIDWTFKQLMLIPNPNKKLMTIENFLERGKDFSGKCIIIKPLSSRIATCIKVNKTRRGDEVYMNVSHSSIVFYPEIAFDIPIDSKNSCHCRTEKDYPAEKELLYDTHTLIEVISEEEFMTLRNEVNNQNSTSSTQSTNEPKTAKDLGIKIGDWFEIPQIYAESNGKERRFLRVENITDLEIRFKEVNVEPTNPDVDHTIEVEERPWLIKYFHKNADGTFFWETERDGRLDFERRDINVVRKEVTCCLNLEVEDELRDLNLLETKPEEKLKKSKYLKYVKDNEVYYLNSPKYETKKILEQEKFCVIASGITIINNRINHHSCNGDELNLIRLMFDNEEEFFNNVTEIGEYEYHTLWYGMI